VDRDKKSTRSAALLQLSFSHPPWDHRSRPSRERR